MKRVTGIVGIFFKCQDRDKMREWYNTHLGVSKDPEGNNIELWEPVD